MFHQRLRCPDEPSAFYRKEVFDQTFETAVQFDPVFRKARSEKPAAVSSPFPRT